MNRELVGTPAHSRSILLVFAAVLLFLALRIPLLVVRQPFFDELATVVFARAGWSQQWAMLQQDSASPLYVAIARVWELAGTFTVTAGRVLSLLFGLVSLACLLVATRRWQPAVGATAALFLAAFPPHVYFSTEARAYALAGLLVGAAALSLYQWMESRGSRWLAFATLSLVLAAYSHGYGVLLFPAPLVVGLLSGNRAAVKNGLIASALAGLLFLPGFWLASVQPYESIHWMSVATSEGLLPVLGTFQQLGFAATYPSAIMISPPVWLRLLSMIVVIPVLILGAWKSVAGRLFAIITLLPIAAVLLLALVGRTLYFPVRFESVLAVPFVLWLASGLAILPRAFRLAAMSLLLGMGAAVCILAIADHDTRPPDPFRSVSRAVRQRVDPRSTLVVSGYSYLELLNQTDQQWHPQLLTFPREQERHPGWVGRSDPATLQREARGLPDRFVWVGVGFSPEATVLAQHFDLREIARDQVVVAAEAIRKPGGRASEEP